MSGFRSDLVVAANALGPWEGPAALPFAIEALRQLSAELRVLRAALCDTNEGPLCTTIVSRSVAGLAERAEAAAEVADRLLERSIKEQHKRERSEAAQ